MAKKFHPSSPKRFHQPKVNPFSVPKKVGVPNLVSRYLFNDYYVEYTPQWWREAIDRAINYSDLTYVDSMYSFTIQSSPFLCSQINKRLVPIKKMRIVLEVDGKEDIRLTEMIVRTKWFDQFKRACSLSKFYGVVVFGIDPKTDSWQYYPMRNVDLENRALRFGTYEYMNVVNVDEYDNIFFFRPETDQDFGMGLLQPISRAMIGIVEAYNNWSILGKRFSYPTMVIGFDTNNTTAQQFAAELARKVDIMETPIIPFFYDSATGGKSKYMVEVNPVQTQSYPDAFRVFKEYISEYRSEIMQLVTGGTLLGATEKNTNSEQLASIHMELYQDIIADDKKSVLSMLNEGGALKKIARLYGEPALERARAVEVPDLSIPIDKAEIIMNGAAKMGIQLSANFFKKIGLEESDINTKVRNNSWNEVLSAKIGSIFGRSGNKKTTPDPKLHPIDPKQAKNKLL